MSQEPVEKALWWEAGEKVPYARTRHFRRIAEMDGAAPKGNTPPEGRRPWTARVKSRGLGVLSVRRKDEG